MREACRKDDDKEPEDPQRDPQGDRDAPEALRPSLRPARSGRMMDCECGLEGEEQEEARRSR